MRVLIFGNGRVGQSLAAYARHLGHGAQLVGRRDDPAAVSDAIRAADMIAVAIPDDRIASWLGEWRATIGDRPAIHFSGALTIPGMHGYHPLYSFPQTPLSPQVMAKIWIAREAAAPPFAAVLPGAANPEFEVRIEDRAFYHALAVLSGNFAAHLWNETAKAFAARFDAPPAEAMGFYLAGVAERFREHPFDSLTGPVARKDEKTVRANLEALAQEPKLWGLYVAFLKSAWPGLIKETDGR